MIQIRGDNTNTSSEVRIGIWDNEKTFFIDALC